MNEWTDSRMDLSSAVILTVLELELPILTSLTQWYRRRAQSRGTRRETKRRESPAPLVLLPPPPPPFQCSTMKADYDLEPQTAADLAKDSPPSVLILSSPLLLLTPPLPQACFSRVSPHRRQRPQGPQLS